MKRAAAVRHSGLGSLDADQIGRLVDQLPVIVWHTDRDLCIRSRRGGGLAPLGPLVEPAQGQKLGANVENPEQAARIIAAHRAALAGEGTMYEMTLRGRTYSARVEPLYEAAGAVVGVVGMAFDVTDQRRVEDALRESEARLRTIIESEPECVKLVDREGRLLEMNPAGLAMIEADN